jgi:predicted DNA-binding protein (UPF0251 family)
MSRPNKNRLIKECPKYLTFKPIGVTRVDIEKINLSLDEYEALRLADFEQMYQEAAAQAMGVSRATFGNIIKSARKKLAEMVVIGKALNIEGGEVEFLTPKCTKCRKKLDKCLKIKSSTAIENGK